LALGGYRTNASGIDAGSVICDKDDDVLAFPMCGNPDRSRRRFAVLYALRFGFNAVIDRVANNVNQRFRKVLNHSLIRFRIFTVHDQANGLADLSGQVADETREPLEHMPHRHNTDVERRYLQFVDEAV
jgi:hypothetical protein